MKKWFLKLVTAGLLVLTAACSSQTGSVTPQGAEQTAQAWLDDLQSGNFAGADALTDNSDLKSGLLLDELGISETMASAAIGTLVRGFVIQDTVEQGDTATVYAGVEAVDYTLFENGFTADMLPSILFGGDSNFRTYDLAIHMTYIDGQWKVDSIEPLV